ncbi:MAG: cation:proton antiporter, partial [Candidatus Competibacteraceae bacterium]|nr:cation:proton antiporter [Candidatus Competibacteraceae bacterium]
MEETTQVLLSLFIMLAAAKIMAELFERLHQPAVVGEILAGVIIGPSLLGWVQLSEVIQILAEIGVIFLLFNVGLETKPSAILRVGARAAVVAISGVILPFVCGYLFMRLWGENTIQALFIGTAMVATSVGITVRVLRAMGVLDAPTSRIILGAAVIDDVLGLIVLAIVSNTATGTVNYLDIAGTAALALGFTVAVALIGGPIVSRSIARIEMLRINEPVYIIGIVLCLGLAVVAADLGVSAIIGAFLAGMALSEATAEHYAVHHQTNGVTEFLVPFFLVSVGMQVKLDALTSPTAITLALSLLSPGERLVVPHDCYGGSWRLFDALAKKGHFELVVADLTDPVALRNVLAKPTRLVWI